MHVYAYATGTTELKTAAIQMYTEVDLSIWTSPNMTVAMATVYVVKPRWPCHLRLRWPWNCSNLSFLCPDPICTSTNTITRVPHHECQPCGTTLLPRDTRWTRMPTRPTSVHVPAAWFMTLWMLRWMRWFGDRTLRWSVSKGRYTNMASDANPT
ncbi:hypothetical protein H257_07191 [Aphanomyces astaci]|uniref:Uncharacterized protein n=1 Tax=Aphanomyces astaci TaxID=112090 RepID=W4GM83_APHAT|nr:hypothetical protein H257_07191 [Aphanomyces astaci]ETV79998.1 hypothetical protein H257_07191 [Aphanomyces astaci]|eukprot:XP_009830934.1 hypothetical protein H257_07191 [Aphanomyces astaci]